MGRYKKVNGYTEAITFRITEEQKELVNNNKFIKDELKTIVRNYLQSYIIKKDTYKTPINNRKKIKKWTFLKYTIYIEV